MTDDAEPVGLRDRKKDQTRRHIEATALEMFVARGFDHVTVDDIAAACDVSRATIFRYFPTKEDLVIGNEPELLLELQDEFERRPPSEAVFESVRQSLIALTSRYEHERDRMLAVRAIVTNHGSLLPRALALHAEWIPTFAGLIARRTGNHPPDLWANVLAAAAMAAVHVAVEEWLDTDAQADVASLIGDALDLLAAGFETDPAPH